jgi:hypothetical protein
MKIKDNTLKQYGDVNFYYKYFYPKIVGRDAHSFFLYFQLTHIK